MAFGTRTSEFHFENNDLYIYKPDQSEESQVLGVLLEGILEAGPQKFLLLPMEME